MLYIGFISNLIGIYSLTQAFHHDFTWFLAGIIFYTIGLLLIIDCLASMLEEKSIEYHSSPEKNGTSLYKIAKNNKKQFIIESTLRKWPKSIIIYTLTLTIFAISLSYLFYYFKTENFYWIITTTFSFIVGLYFLILSKQIFLKKAESIILDKKNKEILIKSPVQREIQNVPFNQIKQIIVRTVKIKEEKKKSLYFDKVYQVIFELSNGKKKILERSQDSRYIQELVSKFREIIKVDVVDLASLDLQVKKSKYNTEENKSLPMWTHLVYDKKGAKESFKWKAKESLSTLYLELFFILCNLLVISYIYYEIAMPKMFDLILLFSGILLIQAILFIRNHFGYESFIFTEDGIIYQYKLLFVVLTEKSLKSSEVKNAIILFDDAILEGENHYLIGNISILSPAEKQWLKNKWNRLLHISTSNELEKNLVRFS